MKEGVAIPEAACGRRFGTSSKHHRNTDLFEEEVFRCLSLRVKYEAPPNLAPFAGHG
jgi:hypothetical protein